MIDAVGVDQRWVDGRALDHGTLGGEIAHGETDGGGEPAGPGAIRIHDDVVGIDAVARGQVLAQFVAAWAALPPVQAAIERLSGNGLYPGVEQARPSQVEHHLGQSSGQKDLHGGEVAGTIGQRVHQARDGSD